MDNSFQRVRMHEGMSMCGCPHHKIVPLCISLIGLAFLLQALDVLSASFVSMAWPILLIVIGLQKMGVVSCKCCAPKM